MELEHTDRLGFSLRYSRGMAALTVYPVKEEGRPVYTDDIFARMRILGIPSVPAGKIREIAKLADGKPHDLVAWPAGAVLNGTVVIDVSEDKMTARAVVKAPRPGGAPVNLEELKKALKNSGVIRGLNPAAMNSCLSAEKAGQSIVVAEGQTPRDGQPAHTECLFITDRGKPWKELGGGRIDLKELNFIQDRKAGDVLARRIESVPPADGFNVCGEVLEAGRHDDLPPLNAGEGAYWEGDSLVAETDGNVVLEGDTVSVETLVTVQNVDYSTGNIHSEGSILVKGTVADGFTVEAGGDVQIEKTIGRCNIKAGRNLVLVSGLVGDGDGKCSAGKDLYARFIESAVVSAGGNIVLTEAALHSDVRTNGELCVTEGRGEITGGLIVAGGSVFCKKIGNVYSGDTVIHAGCSPEKFQAFQNLANTLKSIRKEEDDIYRQIDYYKSKNEDFSSEIEVLERAMSLRQKQLQECSVQLKHLRANLVAPDGISITARERIYSGSSLLFGLEEYQLGKNGEEKVVLRRELGKTVMHGYSATSDSR